MVGKGCFQILWLTLRSQTYINSVKYPTDEQADEIFQVARAFFIRPAHDFLRNRFACLQLSPGLEPQQLGVAHLLAAHLRRHCAACGFGEAPEQVLGAALRYATLNDK